MRIFFIAIFGILGSIADDRQVLMDFYAATNGPQWIQNQNWGTNVSVCSWYGIFCPFNQGVQQISLMSNGLSGIIPESIGNLGGLTTLKLSSNNLRGSLPASLGKLQKLITLIISFNQFEGSLPSTIGQLSNLNTFEAISSGLGGPVPSSLFEIQLGSLIIGNGNFSGSIPETLSRYYITIKIFNTLMSGPIPTSISNLYQLEMLQLSQNQFAGEIPSSITKIQSLVTLDLSRNQFTGEIPSSIGKMQSLSVLKLDYNQLTGAVPSDLNNIDSCDLSHNHLESSVPGASSQCLTTYVPPCNKEIGATVGGAVGGSLALIALFTVGMIVYRKKMNSNHHSEGVSLLNQKD